MKIRKTEILSSKLYYTFVFTVLISINYFPENTFGETRYEDETRAAMIEMNKLFRHLFPLVPDKAHYIWKASHHGASLGASLGGSLGGSLTLDQPNRHHNSFIDHIENPITRHSSTPQSEANANIRDQQQYDSLSVTVPTSPPHPPVISPILANNFKHIIKSGRRMQTPLGKRGPECMRKCIAQGVLHPVQCHSLC